MDEIDRIRHEKKKKMLESLKVEETSGGNGASNGTPLKLTDTNFNESISSGVVLVDCWAEWCGPCRMLEPTIEELARDNTGKAVIAKLNVDHNPVKANEYRITGIPTMLLFKNGQLADKIVGFTSKPDIQQRIDRLM